MSKKNAYIVIFSLIIIGLVGGFAKKNYDKQSLEKDVFSYLSDKYNISEDEILSSSKVYDKGRKQPEKDQVRVSLKRNSNIDYYFYRNNSGDIVLDYVTKDGEEIQMGDAPL
ncbi:hypothetical protein [Peribacillus simplex]|uniref:hypothetical protein n=1 Tax=Peribacillus simplex TaxID=1478 RepID=UPI003D2E3D0D